MGPFALLFVMWTRGWPFDSASPALIEDELPLAARLGSFAALEIAPLSGGGGPLERMPASEEVNGSADPLSGAASLFRDVIGLFEKSLGFSFSLFFPRSLSSTCSKFSGSPRVLSSPPSNPLFDLVRPSFLAIASGMGDFRSLEKLLPLGFGGILGETPALIASHRFNKLSKKSSLCSVFFGPPVIARPALPRRILSLSSSGAT